MDNPTPTRPRTVRLRAPLVTISDHVLVELVSAIAMWAAPSHVLAVKVVFWLAVGLLVALLNAWNQRPAA